ncbi:hypothetical protein HUS62_09390 [Pseudoalteromonas sp. 0303]|nr:hypothetical protein [Pseudoalteromonas shioyasakiensis]NUJ38669.1 hypothetical protein [Pseudoalteromonas sp. 0303]
MEQHTRVLWLLAPLSYTSAPSQLCFGSAAAPLRGAEKKKKMKERK